MTGEIEIDVVAESEKKTKKQGFLAEILKINTCGGKLNSMIKKKKVNFLGIEPGPPGVKSRPLTIGPAGRAVTSRSIL